MEISQISLARMLLSCFLAGVLMGLVYEILLLPRLLLFGVLSATPERLQTRLAPPGRLCLWKKREKAEISKTAYHKNKGKRIGSALLLGVADTLFCPLCAVLLLVLCYATNDGQLRLSAVLALLLGVLLCRMTLLRPLSLIIQCTYVVLRSLLLWMVALLSYPLLKALQAIWQRTAAMRARMWEKYQRYRQRRAQRAEQKKHKQEYSDIISSNIENAETPIMRAAPDGRRVFCTGVSHAGRK